MPVEKPQLAGFGIRLIAHVIDSLTVAVVDLPFRLVAANLDSNGNSGAATLVTLAGFAVSLYAYAYWTGQRGGTPLRVALGIYIVDADTGAFIGTRRGLTRVLMGYVSGIVLFLGYLSMLWSPYKQTWHDLVAKSIVVRR
jgi:uncharacterized RDD family membrane protein YckC